MALLLWTLLVATVGAFSIDYRLRHYREQVRASAIARGAAVQEVLGIALRQWAALPANLARRRAVRDFAAARDAELEGVNAAAWETGHAAYLARAEVRQMDEELAAVAADFGLPLVGLVSSRGRLLATTPTQGDRGAAARVDLSSRGYLRDALARGQGSQFVLGRVSGVAGLYFAARIESQGRAVGAAVVKQDAEVINRMLADARGHVIVLTDANGVVVLGNREDWLLRRLDSAPAIPADVASEVYQRQPELLPWAPEALRTHGPDVMALPVDGVSHLVSRSELAGHRLTTWVLAPLGEQRAIVGRFVAGLTALWLIGIGMLAFAHRRLQWMQAELAARQRVEAADGSRRASDERFAAVYEHASSAHLFFTPRAGIDQCNPAALRLFGAASEDELRGRILWFPPLSAPLQPDGRSSEEVARESLQRHLDERTRLNSGVWRFQRLDGTEFDAEYTVIALEFEGPARFCVVLRDVTAQRETEAALRAAKASAEAASRAKSSFLANMSHELRTPMNAIIGMSHLALQDGLPPRQRGYVEKAHRAARSLLSILNDVLDMSKIESGQLELERVEFDIDTVVGEMADVLGLRADEKGLELLFRAGPDLPRRLVGDPTRLRQVLVNLGSNAVKFTDAGEVTVGMDVQAQTEHDVTLHVWVRDTGPGIAPEQQARLFQPFVQADSSTTRRFGGTGLGLVICRELVERMGGRIWLDSAVGRGTTFHFTATFGRSLGRSAPRDWMLHAVRGRRALLVDDNAAALEVLGAMLQDLGIAVDRCENGEAALARLQAEGTGTYTWLLLDWKMPGMDGVALARHILELDARHRPCVLLVTAFGRDEALRAAEGLALAGVLQKPVTPSSLYDCLVEARRLTPGAALIEQPVAQRGDPAVPLMDRARNALGGTRVLVVEDNTLNQELARELLERAGLQVTLAEDGARALERFERDGPFDAVLMDCQMPVMDGYAATRALRARPDGATVPIIAMTASALAEDRQRAMDAGMNAHLTKPLQVELLMSTLQAWIKPGAGAPAVGEPIDVAAAMARCLDRPDLFRRLLRGFRQSQADFVSSYRRALADGRTADAARAVHDLTGLAGTIGAEALREAALALHDAAPGEARDAALERLGTELDRVLGRIGTLLND